MSRPSRRSRRSPRLARMVSVLVLALAAWPAAAAEPDRIVPSVVSTAAPGGGTWRTLLQVHNPLEETSRLELTFRRAGAATSASDPTATLEVAGGQTVTVEDVLRDLFRVSSVSGSLDVRAASGELPVLDVQVTRDIPSGGNVGLPVPVVAPAEALAVGERAVLLVPAAARTRFNIGARTLGESPAELAITVRDASGAVQSTSKRTLDGSSFLQLAASDFVGASVAGGDAVVFDVTSGSLFLYGTPVDETSGDGSYQAASRVAVPVALTSDFTPPTGREGNAEGGPGVMRLMTATSSDGLTFTRTGLVVTDQGDVPDLVTDAKGWVYLYYVGWRVGTERHKLCVAISRDRGKTWIYKKAVMSGFEGQFETVDPDVQVLPDGTFRAYVTSTPPGQTFEQAARTYVAEGPDGIHFTSKGLAFVPPTGLSLDPSTVKIGSTWHLFAGGEPGANLHATSADGRTFTYDRTMTFKKDGVGQLMANGVPVAGGARFYTFDAIPAGPTAQVGIHSVFTPDGVTWSVEDGTRLAPDPSSAKESRGVKDPAVTKLADGTWLMVYATKIP